MDQIDITKLDIKELKAMAYDCIAQKEVAEANLKAINEEIIKKSQPQVEEVK